jgi:hypothetical protein
MLLAERAAKPENEARAVAAVALPAIQPHPCVVIFAAVVDQRVYDCCCSGICDLLLLVLLEHYMCCFGHKGGFAEAPTWLVHVLSHHGLLRCFAAALPPLAAAR